VEVPVEGAPLVLRNAAAGGRALHVRLRDPTAPGNPQAIGAEVRLELPVGGTLRRRVMPTRSYLSQMPPEAAFGPGGRIPLRIVVRWPDGAETTHAVPEPGAGSVATITRPTAATR
jgi:hypothetical protein